jgi:hypothetical protein
MIVWCDAPEERTAKAGWAAILAALDGTGAKSRPAYRRMIGNYMATIRAALKTA